MRWAMPRLAFTLCLCFAVWPHQALAESKSAAMVLDANTGKILYARSADAKRYPASLTKMMTLYMVFDEIKAGRLTFKTPIKMTPTAAMRPPSKLGLKPGQTIVLKDAVRALVTKSANDVAAAVAEHIAGSEAAFARRMTRRARSLGMTSTTFKNASGLTADGQLSTARDMITLALRLQDDYPQHFYLFSTPSFKYGRKTYRNHNTLLRSMRGVNGIKTGYTRASGFNLVTSMRQGRKHVVAAVFGGKTARARNARMRSLLYSALRKASTRKTRNPVPQLIAKPAKAKPVHRKIVQRAQPRPAAKTSQVAVAGTPPALAPRPFRPAPSDHVQPPRAQPKVAMARVRRVSVLGNQQPQQRRTPVFAPAAQPSVARTKLPPPATTMPVRFANAAATSAPQRPAVTTSHAQTTVHRGRPPSTLNQQAAALLAQPQRNYGAGLARMGDRWGLNGPRAAPTPRAHGGYHIQVGAFPTTAAANAHAENVRKRMATTLQGYQPITIPVMVRGKQLWRVRFAGFESAGATATCNELRRNNIDCFVARP